MSEQVFESRRANARARAAQSVAALRMRGGERRSVRFTARANAAAETILALTGESDLTAVINRLLIEEAQRVVRAANKGQEQ